MEKEKILIDDTPLDYSTLPDYTPEECDKILEEERERLKKMNENK